MEGQRCNDGQNGRYRHKNEGVEKRAAFLCHAVGVKSQTIARARGWRFYPLFTHFLPPGARDVEIAEKN